MMSGEEIKAVLKSSYFHIHNLKHILYRRIFQVMAFSPYREKAMLYFSRKNAMVCDPLES